MVLTQSREPKNHRIELQSHSPRAMCIAYISRDFHVMSSFCRHGGTTADSFCSCVSMSVDMAGIWGLASQESGDQHSRQLLD